MVEEGWMGEGKYPLPATHSRCQFPGGVMSVWEFSEDSGYFSLALLAK